MFLILCLGCTRPAAFSKTIPVVSAISKIGANNLAFLTNAAANSQNNAANVNNATNVNLLFSNVGTANSGKNTAAVTVYDANAPSDVVLQFANNCFTLEIAQTKRTRGKTRSTQAKWQPLTLNASHRSSCLAITNVNMSPTVHCNDDETTFFEQQEFNC
jgi:hypothetical protein